MEQNQQFLFSIGVREIGIWERNSASFPTKGQISAPRGPRSPRLLRLPAMPGSIRCSPHARAPPTPTPSYVFRRRSGPGERESIVNHRGSAGPGWPNPRVYPHIRSGRAQKHVTLVIRGHQYPVFSRLSRAGRPESSMTLAEPRLASWCRDVVYPASEVIRSS